jgi:hypothetical protein
MSGSRITAAGAALNRLLDHLLPLNQCLFNIVGFGSNFEKLFPDSATVVTNNLQKAKLHCSTLEADLGGTEILSPLQNILQTPPTTGFSRQLFILTDGAGFF